jgi:peptide/nickel transport system substrate-binding protein
MTRYHGYMVYDTLFSMDANDEVRPQMVDTVTLSTDQLTYTMRLRDGLLWHDGQPVTAEDCVASIKRWAAKDALAQKLFSTFGAAVSAADARTIIITLKEPTPLVPFALGKSSAYIPFMMPKRVAETPPNVQITDTTGSGPFVLKRDEWKPGDRAVYVRFDGYKPRAEPASALAGGKVAKVDRVEWLPLGDQQLAVDALRKGEIDYLELLPHDLLRLIEADPNLKIVPRPGAQFVLRLNSALPPFTNPKVRAALWHALNQQDFLAAAIGDSDYDKPCRSFYACGTPMATEAGMAGLLTSDAAASRRLLAEAGYDGQPVVLLNPTGIALLANLAPVAKQLMEQGGFKVDIQSIDVPSLTARLLKKDSWNMYPGTLVRANILDPLVNHFMNASCEKAEVGSPCDSTLEALREAFLRATDPAARKAAATAAQERAVVVTPYIPLGEFFAPIVVRKRLDGVLVAQDPVFWNISKTVEAKGTQ